MGCNCRTTQHISVINERYGSRPKTKEKIGSTKSLLSLFKWKSLLVFIQKLFLFSILMIILVPMLVYMGYVSMFKETPVFEMYKILGLQNKKKGVSDQIT